MNILECPHCSKKLYIYQAPMQIASARYLQRDYKLLSRFLTGERQAHLAKEHKISATRLDQILRRVINKLDPSLYRKIGSQLTLYRSHAKSLQSKINRNI